MEYGRQLYHFSFIFQIKKFKSKNRTLEIQNVLQTNFLDGNQNRNTNLHFYYCFVFVLPHSSQSATKQKQYNKSN